MVLGMKMLVGYARVSTLDQNPQLQIDALKQAGCERLYVEKASGAHRDRPELKAALEYMRPKLQAPVVTLKHLAAEIAEAHEVPKARAETMLADTVDRLARHLVKGNKVRIVGLGIFQVKRREARMGRNPQTGEAVKIKASKKVTFRAGKELKEAV